MLISFIFSYSENFFLVFYSSFFFVLGQDPSARDTRRLVLIVRNIAHTGNLSDTVYIF